MEESEINENLSPYSSSFTKSIDDSHVNLVTKETSGSVGCNTCNNHVHKMILDNVVLELHMEVKMMVRFCCRVLDLFIEVTSIEPHEHGHLT